MIEPVASYFILADFIAADADASDLVSWVIAGIGAALLAAVVAYRLIESRREGAKTGSDPFERLDRVVDPSDAAAPTGFPTPDEPEGADSIVSDLAPGGDDIWFAILGLDRRTADRKSLDEAYRLAAVKNHPDKNRNDPYSARRFRIIEEAYERLRKRLARPVNRA